MQTATIIRSKSGGFCDQSKVGNTFGFTARRHDAETGMMYFRNRCFDPQTGEFLSKDPKEFVDGMSMFRGYFQITNVDPEGEFVLIVLGGAVVVGALIGGGIAWANGGDSGEIVSGAVGGGVGGGLTYVLAPVLIPLGATYGLAGGIVGGGIAGGIGGAGGGLAGEGTGVLFGDPFEWSGVSKPAIGGAISGGVLGGVGVGSNVFAGGPANNADDILGVLSEGEAFWFSVATESWNNHF